MKSAVSYEIKQVRNYFDTSLKSHLMAKGALCPCCDQPATLCRCVTERAKQIAETFKPRSNG